MPENKKSIQNTYGEESVKKKSVKGRKNDKSSWC